MYTFIYSLLYYGILIFNNRWIQFGPEFGLDRNNYFGVNNTWVQVHSRIEFKSSKEYRTHGFW